MKKYSSNAGQPIKEVEVLSLGKAVALLRKLQNCGQIFRVDFKKKDGSMRSMNCRFGVRKGITGKGRKYSATDKGLLTVWESGEGWKNITVDEIRAIKHSGIWYMFNAPSYMSKGTYPRTAIYRTGRTVEAHTSPMF